MSTDIEHSRLRGMTGNDHIYPPDILPRLQSLLAKLADIDVAHEKILEAVGSSSVNLNCKDAMIADLCRSHLERRAPFVGELLVLRDRMKAMSGLDGCDVLSAGDRPRGSGDLRSGRWHGSAIPVV
jgi:hypothetical protein